MIHLTADDKPRLATKARLRFDRKSGRYMLLYPEKGLVLSPTASEILALCTGERTVGDIVATLVAKYSPGGEAIEEEVFEFLGAMASRGLLEGWA